ncbi:hypothetical protein LIER_05294 [Lithospermum erythrorhizon]|uniref:Uncharacterized protein n=1 Tax=Lithospermum erythrorhizon TaxID=34254 RepID=A0AAV3P2S4_LITER
MAALNNTTFTTILIILLVTTPLNASSDQPQQLHRRRRPFTAIYAFGDSFTDTGNTESTSGPNAFTYVSNPPYGRTFFHHPTNRYSDGRLVIDFIAQSLSLPFLPPYRNKKMDKSFGTNFAVAGATAVDHSFFVKNNMTLNITPQSLGTELRWFNEFLESKGCRDSKNTPKQCEDVFKDALIWAGEIGANDYAYSFGTSVSGSTIQQLAIQSVAGFLQAMLEKGAKYVIVEGLPPTGCLTLSMFLASEEDRDDMGCVGSQNKLSMEHNTALQAKLNGLRKQFPQAMILYADYYSRYRSIMKDAAKYGIKEPFKACCGSGFGEYNFDVFGTCGSNTSTSCAEPSQYVNWDGVHLTEAMYKLVANSFVNGTSCNPSFSSLLEIKERRG